MNVAVRPRLVDHPDLDNVMALDRGVMPMLERMEQTGMLLDLNRVAEADREFRDELGDIEAAMEKLIGRKLMHDEKWPKGRFNAKSGDQVAVLLFDDLGLDDSGLKMTKSRTRVKTDKKALEKLREAHPIVPLLLEHTEISKLRDAFTLPLPKWVGPDGRVRPRIKYTRVTTGRLAMIDPNMMQIPIHTKRGAKIRRCFIPRDGCVYVAIDQSQIEMRVAAHLSADDAMCGVFLRGEDMHWNTARLVYGLPIPADPDNPQDGELTSFMRTICKNVGFGILYGITKDGLYDQIVERITNEQERATWSPQRCQEELIDGYFQAYPSVKRLVDKFHRTARMYGYIYDGWGRVRLTPGVRAADNYTVEKTLREVGNHPIQGTAQGCMKLGMADAWEFIDEMSREIHCEPLLQIHDELMLEVKEEEADGVIYVVQKYLENAVKLRVPVTCGANKGYDWSEVK